jgi:uncharacterized membrane protein
MLRSRLQKYFLPILLITTAIVGVLVPQVAALAQVPPAPTSTAVPRLQLDCPYPSLSNYSGSTFTFDIDIKYYNTDTKLFNINVTPISGWNITTRASDTGKEISSVQITGNGVDTPAIESIQVSLIPTGNLQPDPGPYNTTLTIGSDTFTQKMNLVANVKPQFAFSLNENPSQPVNSPSIVLNSAGGTPYNFSIINSGSATIENLALSANTPSGWNIAFNPAMVASVPAGQNLQITATLTPPKTKDVDGDYTITLKAANQTISTSMDVRVRVVTPGFPTWAVMAIIIAVVIVLAIAYHFLIQRRTTAGA